MRRWIHAMLLIALLGVLPPVAAHAEDDWPLPEGHFFTQTGGGGGQGYPVSDKGGIRFWSELQRLGGVATVGYPISGRFSWNGFTVQAFQRVVFQWRPENGTAAFVNIFDVMSAAGKDDLLLAARQVPNPAAFDEAGKAFDQITSERLALLDSNPAIKSAYFGVVGDPVQSNGLPTSPVVDMGNNFALRAQRVVLQQWKEDTPWARKGEVTVALGGDIAKEVGLLPDPEALLAVAPATVGAIAEKRMFAYYVPYDPTSWASLQEHAGATDNVGAQWVTIDACGNIGSRDDQTLKQFARTQGIKVFPSLLTSSGWLNHRILTDEAVSAHAISQIVAYVLDEGYDGFDLDLEGVEAGDRAAYTDFVARLGAALHEHGKTLALAIPAKTRDVTTGWAGAYDYAALGRHADLITIMTYDYHGSWGGPGPVAPYGWVEDVMAFATGQIPTRKVLLGLAFYGYDWNVTSDRARALNYAQAAELSGRYQAPMILDLEAQSATFSYRAPAGDPPPAAAKLPPLEHNVTERKRPPCPVQEPSTPPASPRPTPPPGEIQEHVVWVEDSVSADARLGLADRYQTGGIATWRLGQEDPRFWANLGRWRGSR